MEKEGIYMSVVVRMEKEGIYMKVATIHEHSIAFRAAARC